MKITEIAVDKLNPAPYNPRRMAPAELVKLTWSIAEFGLVDPLIVNKDMTVIGGHQRLAAALADLSRAIELMEKTKGAFKSPAIAEARSRAESAAKIITTILD